MTEEQMIGIYVLPSVANTPPKALLMTSEPNVTVNEEEEGVFIVGVDGTLAVWMADMGTWCVNGLPVQPELAEAITTHARNLGVEW